MSNLSWEGPLKVCPPCKNILDPSRDALILLRSFMPVSSKVFLRSPLQTFTWHPPADLIFGFLQPKLIIKSQLDPGALWGVEAPRQQEVPGVAAGEARTVDAAVPCHADGLLLSVQVCEVIALC